MGSKEELMIGFVVGSLCLVALVKLARMRRRWYACGMGRHHHHHRRHRWGHGGPVSFLSQAVDATPEQEKVIAAAFRELDDARRGLKDEWKTSRRDVARAFDAESFDAEVLGHAFARHDEVLESLRRTFVGALAKVHDVLDPRQRAKIIGWLDGDAAGFGFSPYR
jgi:Spy/CpxP family protein refolding chaperone